MPIAIGTVGFYIVFEERAWIYAPAVIVGALAFAGIAFGIVKLLCRLLTPADRKRLEKWMNDYMKGAGYSPR